jgi:hypothetical protein
MENIAATHMAHVLQVAQRGTNLVKCFLLLVGFSLDLLPVFVCQ